LSYTFRAAVQPAPGNLGNLDSDCNGESPAPQVVLAHPSLFTATEIKEFERCILADPNATERHAADFFERFPKFLLLGQGAELRREAVLLNRHTRQAFRVDFLRRSYGTELWDLIELKGPHQPFMVAGRTRHPRLSAIVQTAIFQGEDYRDLLREDPVVREDLRKRGYRVNRPRLIVVVGRDAHDVTSDMLQTLRHRVREWGIEAYSYDALHRFAKEHYESNCRIIIPGEIGRYPADLTLVEERLLTLRNLLVEFDSWSHEQSGQICPACEEGIVVEHDKVQSAGGGAWVYRTLYHCDRCGYHRLGEEYWTTDY
jgi:hypothetical protein